MHWTSWRSIGSNSERGLKTLTLNRWNEAMEGEKINSRFKYLPTNHQRKIINHRSVNSKKIPSDK